MSHKGNLDISKSEKDNKETKHCTCTKVFFGISNSLCWFVSIGILGLASWQAAGQPESFTSGTSSFTYGLIAVSILNFVMCVLGFLASLNDHLNVVGSFVIICVLLLFIEAGLVLACYVTYGTGLAVIQQIWFESTSYILEATELSLECCGLSTWTDTYAQVSLVPDACININNSIHATGCGEEISAFFTSSAVLPLFVAVISIPAIIQVLTLVSGGMFLHQLLERLKQDVNRSPSKNAVVPIMVTNTDKQGYISGSRSAKSVISGKDVALDVNPSKQKGAQGNAALFRVAGVMLED